jgi:DMSO/TMAO reductase YedYZ molybdopterin-dependent catalytic subunit
MSDAILLIVDGAVKQSLKLTLADLDAVPESDRVRDVSRFHPTRQGDGVTLAAILQQAGVEPGANYLTLHADPDDFHVSVPLEPLLGQGILVYRKGSEPLDPQHGGPIRFLIRDPSACHSSELDECANVKYLSRIELTERRGRDTRPADEAAHAALHAPSGASEPPAQ